MVFIFGFYKGKTQPIIEKEADIEAKNNKAETSFDIAKKRFNESFLEFLKINKFPSNS